MPPFEERDQSGTLWINDRKEEGDRLPDRTGYIVINGKKWSLAGWIRKDKNGQAYMSLKASEPRGREQVAEPRDTVDDIPGF